MPKALKSFSKSNKSPNLVTLNVTYFRPIQDRDLLWALLVVVDVLRKAKQNITKWAVVVAQLVERSLPIPEVRSSNPVIGKNLLNICLLSTVY